MSERMHKLATLPAGTRFLGASGKVVYMVLDLANLPGSHNAPKGEVWGVVLSSPRDSTHDYRPGMVRAFRDSLPVVLVDDSGPEGETVLVTNRPRHQNPHFDRCHHGSLNPKTGKTVFLCNLPAGHAGPHQTDIGGEG